MAESDTEKEEFGCCENCGLSVYDASQPGWMACMAGIDVVPVRADFTGCPGHIFEDDYYELYYGKDDY